MNKVVIVSALRTPVGKRGQSLSKLSPTTLSSILLQETLQRSNLDAGEVDEIIYGNLLNFDLNNAARLSWLEAGFPIETPGLTVNRRCASSLASLEIGTMMIQTGRADIVMTGGVESYSQNPFMIKRSEDAFPRQLKVLETKQAPEFIGNIPLMMTAEKIAEKYNVSREESDEFAYRSHQLASISWGKNYFSEQVIPITVPVRKKDDLIVNWDDCVNKNCTLEGLSKLNPVLKNDGIVTAGNSSPMNDGASAILIMSEKKAKEKGFEILGEVKESTSVGCDPTIMGIGPVPATSKLFKRTGYSFNDIDLIEINEAFACQTIACLKEFGLYNKKDMKKVNIEGGAISIGHPNAASGGILVARMIYALRRRGLRRGLITFCIGGGQGTSLIVENPNI